VIGFADEQAAGEATRVIKAVARAPKAKRR
jgi:hypothetical protein